MASTTIIVQPSPGEHSAGNPLFPVNILLLVDGSEQLVSYAVMMVNDGK